MLDKIRPYLGWGLLALLAIFILLNLRYTEINLFFIVRVEIPTAFVILISAALGAGAAYGLLYLRQHRKDKAPADVPPRP